MGEADTINKRCPRTASTAGGVANALVVDHVDHDRSNNDRDNLVPSCQRCNANRGSI